MTEYVVRWEIQLDADSPRDAAERALAIHRDPKSLAVFFEVWPSGEPGKTVCVDLDEPLSDDTTTRENAHG